MAKARKLLNRRNAARNIRTITKTMEMVSAARFKRAHKLMASVRPYTARLAGLVADLLARGTEDLSHPLMRETDVKRDVLIVLTADRGLCGSYNASILRLAEQRRRQLGEADYETRLWLVGKRGRRLAEQAGLTVERDFEDFGDTPDFSRVAHIGNELMESFLAGEIGGLEVVYMQFVSSGRQQPAVAQILPLTLLGADAEKPAEQFKAPYEFLPTPEEVLTALLPATVRLKLYQCFVEAASGEQKARVAAMHLATDNADDMIQDLSRHYNRLRQSRITTELAEILGGREGLE